MYKFIALFALLAGVSAAPGFVTDTHHHAVVQPAILTKTAVVDNSASSAITHQSFTNLERKVPLVATYSAAAAAPVVHTYAAAAPVVHSYAAAPIIHHTVHSAPILKTIVSSPIAYHAIH